LRADRLGVTQRANQWMLVSGDAKLKLGGRKLLDVLGNFKVDAGYWELARAARRDSRTTCVIKRAKAGQAKASLPAGCCR
jgi:hypothetical protein